MRGINPSLVFSAQDGMARDELPIFKDPHLVGVALHLKHAFACGVWHAVLIARDRHHALVANPAFDGQNSIVGDCWQGSKAGLLLSEGLIDNAQGRGVHARVRNARAPKIKLGVQIINVAERARQKEVLPDIAERPLNLAFCLGPVGLTCTRHRAVVIEESDQRRVVGNNASLVFADHGRLHPVIEDMFR